MIDNHVQKIKKLFATYNKRLTFLFIVPLIIFIVSLFCLYNQYYYSALLIWFLWPISRVMIIGNINNRVRNTLPFLALISYLIIGLETNAWVYAETLFLVVPIISLALKPKRFVFQYVVLLFSFVTIVLNLLTDIKVIFPLRLGAIILIHIVYYPPVLYNGFKALIKKRDD